MAVVHHLQLPSPKIKWQGQNHISIKQYKIVSKLKISIKYFHNSQISLITLWNQGKKLILKLMTKSKNSSSKKLSLKDLIFIFIKLLWQNLKNKFNKSPTVLCYGQLLKHGIPDIPIHLWTFYHHRHWKTYQINQKVLDFNHCFSKIIRTIFSKNWHFCKKMEDSKSLFGVNNIKKLETILKSWKIQKTLLLMEHKNHINKVSSFIPI